MRVISDQSLADRLAAPLSSVSCRPVLCSNSTLFRRYTPSNKLDYYFQAHNGEPKRLLGVFIPASRPLPPLKEGNKDAIPIVSAPPLPKERRAELDNGKQPYYDGMSDDELKTLMRERGICLRGRRLRAYWIKALEGASLVEDRNEYESWKGRVEIQTRYQRSKYLPVHHLTHERIDHMRLETFQKLRKRPNMMFAGDIKANPTRMSFFSLSPSVRNQIYDLALFGEDCAKDIFKLSYYSSTDKLLPFSREHSCTQYSGELMLSVFDMLGAMNKQIRNQVRSLFWANP